MTPTLPAPIPEVIELRSRSGPAARAPWRESTFWLLASGMMLFTGVLKGINLVIVLAYLLVALWVLNLWLAARATRGLTARRLPRPAVQAGEHVEWGIEIRDTGKWRGAWVLDERVRQSTASWRIVRTRSAVVFRPRVRVFFPRRGRYIIEPLIARSTFPFGLAGRSRTLLPADELIVYPKAARVDVERLRGWMHRAWVGIDEQRRRLRRVIEREAEVHGLRDYRPGDSPRRIHWKATARRSRLTVREYEDSAPPRLLVVVDVYLPARAKANDRERLEKVITLAAGVCRAWRRESGARLAMVVGGKSPIVIDGPPGPMLTEQMLAALAVEEGTAEPDVKAKLGGLSRPSATAPVLVITNRPGSPIAALATATLGRAVAVANVDQPESWFQLP